MEWYWILTIVLGSVLLLFVLSIVLYKQFFKRFWDIVLSLLALSVLSWLFIILTIVGAIAMKGNPFFVQKRPGKKDKNGKEKIFKLIKFRTMSNAKDKDGNLLPDKKRLNGYGKFLRSTSLDEFPEALNILIGDMSIIGPRPQLIKDLVFMNDEQRKRHCVRPGLSGLAQVNGRNNITWEQKFEYDLQYVSHISIWKDIGLIFKTIGKMFSRSDVTRKGTDSDIDFGDWLLEKRKITDDYFNLMCKKAESCLKSEKYFNTEENGTDILLINDNNLGFLGGERESQLIIINSLKNHFKISVIQPGEFYEQIESVDVVWLTKKKRLKSLVKNPFAFINYIFKVGKKIRELRPRIIHSNSQVSFFIVSFLMRFRLISRNIHFIHTDRGLYTKYNFFFRFLFQLSFKYLDELVTTTFFNKKCWEDANKKKKLFVKYTVIENTAGSIYEQIDLNRIPSHDFLTIGFAGRMCDWKGWPLAEDICSDVDSYDRTFVYMMYVSCLDNASIKKTKKMFDRMKAKFGNRFVGRINVPFSEMEQFYYDVDIFVLTSWPKSESFGRTIVEAMSRKTAVLTTDAGGSVEVVDDSSTIHKTSKEFALHIVGLKNNPSILQKMKDNNLKRVRSSYSLQNNVFKYEKLYLSYLGKGKYGLQKDI